MSDKTPEGHTPGPWSRNIPPARNYPVIFSGRNQHVAILAFDKSMSDGECEANANLISAAPDLLKALKDARAQIAWHLDFLRRNNHTDQIPWLWAQEAMAEYDAEIAKATGA